jgi:hypothetical protein
VHIPKELAIFPNSHTKSDQGAIGAHNFHLGRCSKSWSLGTSVKVRHLDFRPQKWVTVGSRPRGGCLKGGCTEQPDLDLQPFTGISLPYGVGTLDLEDLKVPYLSTSIVLMM